MRKPVRRLTLLASLAGSSFGLYACVADDSLSFGPQSYDGGMQGYDGETPPQPTLDGALPQDAAVEAASDAARPVDAGHDASADGSPADAADSGATNDASGDSAPDDGGFDAAFDAPVDVFVDAPSDVILGSDAPPDSPIDAPVDAPVDAPMDAPVDAIADAPVEAAVDAAVSCISELFGDHYTRIDGKLVWGGGGGPTVVVEDGTGTPLLGVTSVVQQNGHACGLKGDGTVWCWPTTTFGANDNGDLGNGTFGGTLPAIAHATQVVTNAADAGAPSYLTGVTALSRASDTAYTYPTCAIRGDKTVWCWGFSTAQGSPPTGLFYGTTGSTASVPYAIPIAAGPAGADGGVPLLTADQVSVGHRHACVLLAGSVSCWGSNVSGNLANGDSNLNFQPYPLPVVTGYGLPATVDEIASGADFSCARSGGSVWCFGTNSWAQMGNPSVPTAFCNLNYCEPVPTPVQQTLPDGGSSQTPDGGVNQDPLVGSISLFVGYQFGCALDGTGTAHCWGAYNGGVSTWPMATPFTRSAAPYSNIAKMSVYGGDINTGLRYLTQSGAYVVGNSVVSPYCL